MEVEQKLPRIPKLEVDLNVVDQYPIKFMQKMYHAAIEPMEIYWGK